MPKNNLFSLHWMLRMLCYVRVTLFMTCVYWRNLLGPLIGPLLHSGTVSPGQGYEFCRLLVIEV